MPKLELRPVNEQEFQAWRIPSEENYAREKQKEGLAEADAKAEAAKSFSTLLPQGGKTPDHFVYSLIDTQTQAHVGTLWWAKRKYGTRESAWIYDIVVKPEYRGRGFGKQAMQLAMADVRHKGINELGLHVFGHNEVAQNLYRSLGFRVSNLVMQINL